MWRRSKREAVVGLAAAVSDESESRESRDDEVGIMFVYVKKDE